MYIKQYISGMEMSQRIYFWYIYQILLKMLILIKWQKNTFWWKKIMTSWKNNFEIKMLLLLENHVKTLL